MNEKRETETKKKKRKKDKKKKDENELKIQKKYIVKITRFRFLMMTLINDTICYIFPFLFSFESAIFQF